MDFDFGMDACDMDFNFMANEEFGLAKSFTTAPVGLLAPLTSLKSMEEPSADNECESHMGNEIKADGFCFKLHPSEDQAQF
jgi:hypothetical protein